MTPRERYLATLNHVKPDQVPIELGCRPEIMEQLRRHYKVEDDGDVARILGADNGRYIFVNARWREFERKINDGPGGRRIIRHDARTTEDQWGVVQRTGTDGKYEEWIDGPFVHTDDIDSFPWPDESDITIDPSMAARAAAYLTSVSACFEPKAICQRPKPTLSRVSTPNRNFFFLNTSSESGLVCAVNSA